MKVSRPRWCIFPVAFGLLFLLGLASNISDAADRALIVGIGNYQMKGAALPGIDLDISAAVRAAQIMGFDDRNITILRDHEATLAALEFSIERDLVHGVSADDRVFFYYSGHGSQIPDENGDEIDGVDEVLLAFDTSKRYSRGVTRLERVFTDDRFEQLLANIPTQHVLVIIDACHSGTITRNVIEEFSRELPELIAKTYYYESMPQPRESDYIVRGNLLSELNYVGVSAAGDDQLAIATRDGSVFTNAVIEVIDTADRSAQKLSLRELTERVSTKIAASVPESRVFVPQLNGDIKRSDTFMVVDH